MPVLNGRLKLKVSIFMMLIILIFWLIGFSGLYQSYEQYGQAKQSSQRLALLHSLADLSTLISRERGPANIAMGDLSHDNSKSKQELELFRNGLDALLEQAIYQFEQAEQYQIAEQLKQDLRPKIKKARLTVDAFIALDPKLKTKKKMDYVIVNMFDVWDESHSILKQFLYRYQGNDKNSIDLFNLTLLITELRDQAGRLGSNIIAPLIFGNQLPEVNADRALRNQKNIHFLWLMIESIDGSFEDDVDYVRLENRVKILYMQQGLGQVRDLLEQTRNDENFVFDSREFTQAYVKRMSYVVDLQDYIAELSNKKIEQQKQKAFSRFISTSLLVLVANIAIILMLYLLNYKIFAPLLLLREKLLTLLKTKKGLKSNVELNHRHEVAVLFDIIQKIQMMIENRDELEQKLTLLADTDALTGLYNRTALNKKIDYLENFSKDLEQYALLVIDIDNFKRINDQYGHLVGDQAIATIACYIKEIIREDDFAVRYGGDELIILLHHSDQVSALKTAQRLRETIDTHPLYLKQGTVALSVSIGVATGVSVWADLMHRADLALLKAKHYGKNNVQHYDDRLSK